MIKKLQEIFPSLIKKSTNHNSYDYQWYVTPDNEVIGIKKSELTEQTISLLGTFLNPFNINLPRLTKKEQLWADLIKTDEHVKERETEHPYRFTYFSFPENKIKPLAFKEAITDIFTKEIPILWENEHTGIIIEEQINPTEEAIPFEHIIDILMSDLYVKINFFVGPFLHKLKDAKHLYHVLLQGAKVSFTNSEKTVISYLEAIPYIFTDQVGPELRAVTTEIVLKEVADDYELLHTIETFIDCNLNISVTAKELFMHRNSLQYRIDKFIEKTGIDIRQFHEAMTVHLALLSKNHTD